MVLGAVLTSTAPFFIKLMANIQVESKVFQGLKIITIYTEELGLLWLVKAGFIR
jgi:hypothetical protein